MNLSLEGKNALIGGSSKGIGLAAAQEIALLGGNCTLMSRSEESLKKALSELDQSKGQHHQFLVIDNSETEKFKTIIDGHVSDSGIQYSILVNNTGGPPGGPLKDAGLDAIRAAYDQHLICNHILLQAVLPGMRASGYGRIINVISTSVKSPLKGLGVSNTTRGAVASWSKTLASELGPEGITVNNVLPGATATLRLESIIQNKSSKSAITTEEVEDRMRAEIPLGRFAAANEVGAAIAFLASPTAAYINGINLPVDGGRLTTL